MEFIGSQNIDDSITNDIVIRNLTKIKSVDIKGCAEQHNQNVHEGRPTLKSTVFNWTSAFPLHQKTETEKQSDIENIYSLLNFQSRLSLKDRLHRNMMTINLVENNQQENNEKNIRNRETILLMQQFNDLKKSFLQKQRAIAKACHYKIVLKASIEKAKLMDTNLRSMMTNLFLHKNKDGSKIQKSLDQLKEEVKYKYLQMDEQRQHIYHNTKNSSKALKKLFTLQQKLREAEKQFIQVVHEKNKIKLAENLEVNSLSTLGKNFDENSLFLKINRIYDLAEEYFREYTHVRILNEQIQLFKNDAKYLCLLYPKKNIENAFNYESYTKIAKNHTQLSLLLNSRIQCNLQIIKNNCLVTPTKKNLEFVDFSKQVNPNSVEFVARSSEKKIQTLTEGCNIAESQKKYEKILENNQQNRLNLLDSNNKNNLLKGVSSNPVDILNSLIKNNPGFAKNDDEVQKRKETVDVTCKMNVIISESQELVFFDHNIQLKLFYEVELFIKTFLFRNVDQILKALPYTSDQYTHVFRLKKPDHNIIFHNYEQLLQKDALELSLEQVAILNKRKAGKPLSLTSLKDYSPDFQKFLFDMFTKKALNQQISYPPFCAILLGDRDRGTLISIIKQVFHDLKDFDTYALLVKNITFKIEVHKEEIKSESISSIEIFLSYYQEFVMPCAYNDTIVIGMTFELSSKLNLNLCYTKKMQIVMLPHELGDITLFAKQLKSIVNKEKSIVGQKSQFFEKLEPIIKGADKYLFVVELPQLIKLNGKGSEKYQRIKNIVELISKLNS